MDRSITKIKTGIRIFQPFESCDAIPYSIALLLLAGEIYIATHFKYLLFH